VFSKSHSLTEWFPDSTEGFDHFHSTLNNTAITIQQRLATLHIYFWHFPCWIQGTEKDPSFCILAPKFTATYKFSAEQPSNISTRQQVVWVVGIIQYSENKIQHLLEINYTLKNQTVVYEY